MTFYGVTTSQGYKVEATYQNGAISFSAYPPGSKSPVNIDEVVTNFSFHRIPSEQMGHVLSLHSFKFVKLDDGSHKLYLQPCLLGGVLPPELVASIQALQLTDATVANSTIAEKLLALVPAHTYSSITVNTVDYKFTGTAATTQARAIDIRVDNWEWLQNFVSALFSARPATPVLTNRAVLAVLGSADPKDQAAILDAFKKNCRIKVYISFHSDDQQKQCFIDLEESTVTIAAGKCILV